ncbi:DUF6445 family protein [Sphingomonas sp. AX6]|uniref:DUF6445 family protein n=1 Tax=Sphingomonas sp. AX6 TaxID=2653171 RepID=UPI0012F278F5|nr:DUF6445 family protein [Sphingomonas sp. AX6]VXC92365.1 conserved hypothetical protein [Sphingomonas sp. AX6]
MKPQLLRLGEGAHPVVVVDDMTGRAEAVVDLAAALAPFPHAARSYYPGLRRVIDERDTDAFGYVRKLLEDAAPFIAGAFDIDRFDLVEASFSMVTAAGHALAPAQRAPHFDSTDPNHIAAIHYLRGTEASGTAFFRHRATGIERVEAGNVDRYVATARGEATTRHGYAQGSDDHYEEIGRVEGVRDRIVLYRGGLLHSGVIPPDLPLSGDPRTGRLTANYFLQGA